MEVYLEDIYTALRDSVRFYPDQESKCLQPQTWRVLQRSLAAEISTQNLGATICDKDKLYFWSRRWKEAKYSPNGIVWAFPLLYAFEQDAVMIDPFGGRPQLIYNLQIGVLDVLTDDEAARKCSGCNGRTLNEIYRDTQLMLQSSLNYLEDTSGWRINGGPEVWLNRQFVEQALQAQRIERADFVDPGILTDSQKYNPESTFFRAERSAEKIYGTAINIRIAASACQPTTWNFNETDFEILSQEYGCQTC